MFKLQPAPTFDATVPLSVPGLAEPLGVTFTFRHKNKTQLATWLTAAAGKQDAALLHEVVTGWQGMQADNGDAEPYSLAALTTLLENYPTAHSEIFRAYLRELSESKRKN